MLWGKTESFYGIIRPMKLGKTYIPQEFEEKIYSLWETKKAFAPTGKGEPYTIVLPPPNANGNLHIGHALTGAVEDILTRYHRMNGRDAVWIPGSDHAGFETWVVFEKLLEKEGKSRFDYSRDDLYRMTWDFVQEQKGNMENQMKMLGSSADWSQMTFTLDKKVVDRVYKTFKKLWDDGLIYRGERIVNYCTKHKTSFADIEVEFEEEKGKLWEINYLIKTNNSAESRKIKRDYITVATTRPETMLGDEAIAVHPDDTRFKELIGKMAIMPITGKEIPIIADDAVELNFGTGAVKVTPAHDPLDFEIGARHNLPVTRVISEDGRMINVPVGFEGLTVLEAREKVVERLRDGGSLGEIKDFEHQVPHCYKCGTVIEPMVKDQWFVKVEPLANKAKEAIEKGQIKFFPKQKGQELASYLGELKDWNISRQIPWGIPIPAFRRAEKLSSTNHDFNDEWIFDERVDQEFIEVDGVIYHRDEDTFDTWFSSAQWPVVLTSDDSSAVSDSSFVGSLERYPLNVMETGVDILRQWVGRMIMLGLYINDDVPFKDVYLHGLVLDERGQKMSKSKGNVINPMTVVDQYGSDALRIGLVLSRSAGVPQAFSPDKVLAGRNFCNKLWNIARFIMSLKEEEANEELKDPIYQHWVLSKLQHLTEKTDGLIAKYRFAEAMEEIYHVVWDDVADWYVESLKTGGVSVGEALEVLQTILKIVHPFAPFVTEVIWQSMTDTFAGSLLIREQWARKFDFDKKKAAEFEKVREIVSEVRRVTTVLCGGKRMLAFSDNKTIENNRALVKNLAGLEGIINGQAKGINLGAVGEVIVVANSDEIAIYKDKLNKKRTEALRLIENYQKRLANKAYLENAPKALVKETKDELEKAEKTVAQIDEELSNEL